MPVILWASAILAAATDTFSAEHSGGWFRAVFGFELPYAIHLAVRKAAHLVEYGVLAGLAWRASRHSAVALAIAVAVAIADETLQSTSSLRTGSPRDVVIDALGAAIALMILRRTGRMKDEG